METAEKEILESLVEIKKSAAEKMRAIEPIILPKNSENKLRDLFSTYAIAITIRKAMREKIQEVISPTSDLNTDFLEYILSTGL